MIVVNAWLFFVGGFGDGFCFSIIKTAHPYYQESTVHASVPCSKLNTDGDYGTSRKNPTHETLLPPPEPDVSLLQPANTTIPPPLIPPPSDFSSDYVPMVAPPPPPPADPPLQPNYIFINNINEFSGLPAAIRTANYVRPDRTSENFSEAFFDWESQEKKLPPTTNKSNPPPPSSSFRYHLQTSEVQNIPSVDQSNLPEQSIETQYDLILEKETTPPPLPKTPPPPLIEHTPIAVSKYFNLLTGKSQPPVPPPKPTHTNTHAGVSDEKNKWMGFSNAFSQKVIFCVCVCLF